MTPQESRLLQDFLTQLVEAGDIPKDREAADLIQRAARAQPDALYLVVQRSLIQQQALDGAQRRIEDLERAARAGGATNPAAGAGSFLGDNAWGRGGGASRAAPDRGLASEAAAVFGSRSPATGAGGGPAESPVARASAGAGAGAGGSRAGGFLGQAAAMAAGVAGGAFLFHGIGSLLGHNADAAGGFLNPGGLEPITENVTINEYDGNGSNEAGSAAASDQDSRDWGADSARHDDSGGGSDYSDGGGDDFAGDFDGGDFGGDDGLA